MYGRIVLMIQGRGHMNLSINIKAKDHFKYFTKFCEKITKMCMSSTPTL